MAFSAGSLPLMCLVSCSDKHKREKKILNFYNYSNYIDKDTIPNFEKEYNARVNCDYYTNQEIMFAKIKIGVTGYDLIISSDIMARRLIKQNLLLPIESEKISNMDNIMKEFKNPPYDPGHKFTVPYFWGTTVIAYNRKYIREPVKSWEILWNPGYRGKITMLDEKRDSIGCTLLMLGYSGNETDHEKLGQAKKKLLEQRPLIKKYTSDTYMDELITNEVWLAQAWSGDVIQVIRSNPNIDFAIPREGTFIWLDNFSIPAGAPHPDTARDFINYVLRPDVGARIARAVGYATPNLKSYQIIKKMEPKTAQDPRLYPPEEVKNKLVFYKDLGSEERYWNQIWEDVKLGRV